MEQKQRSNCAKGYSEAMGWAIKTSTLRLIQRAWYRSWRGSYEKYLLQTFDSIKICDLGSSNTTEQEEFGSRTVKALQLIKEHDVKRYHRIQKNLAYIVNSRISYTGFYNHSLRSCSVNNSVSNFEGDEDWSILMLACSLVHAATYGALKTCNIPYDSQNYLRMERICHNEEVRFARRILPDIDVVEFDANYYEEAFQMGKWQYLAKYIRSAIKPTHPTVS